jgi:YD repeat-containing protein
LKGDTATSADDRYVQHGYVYNTTDYIVDTLQWQKLYAGTGEAICTTYTSTDVPKTISASGTPTVYSTLTVPDNGLVTDVNVLGLNGTHTYINDLIFTLISPINAQTILMNRACGSQDNFNINFDDESPNAAGTWPCPPTNGGTYRPAGSLATFDGSQLQGTWTLKVQDVYTNDGGSLNGWQLQICRTPPAGDPLAFSEYAYDGQAIGAAPLKGNPTLARTYSQVTPTAAYVETTTAYDSYGRPTTVTDPNGHPTTTAYHTFYGYAQSVTNALNQTSSTVMDPGWGVPTSVTDANGRTTTGQYDAFGVNSRS